jgi:hypothetical protein
VETAPVWSSDCMCVAVLVTIQDSCFPAVDRLRRQQWSRIKERPQVATVAHCLNHSCGAMQYDEKADKRGGGENGVQLSSATTEHTNSITCNDPTKMSPVLYLVLPPELLHNVIVDVLRSSVHTVCTSPHQNVLVQERRAWATLFSVSFAIREIMRDVSVKIFAINPEDVW